MSTLRIGSVATLCFLSAIALTCAECGGGGKGGGSPGAMGNQSTFTSEATTIASTCSNPDAGLMPTGEGTFSATDFCKLYLATCQGLKDSLPDTASCMDNYNAAKTLASGDMQHCRSNHICNAAVFFPNAFVTHCMHAIGIDLCN